MSVFWIANKWTERVTEAAKTIDSDHAYIHAGRAFEVSSVQEVNGTYQYGLDIPTSTVEGSKYIHWRPVAIATEKGQVTFSILEGSTRDSTGTELTAYNRNRESTKPSIVTFTANDGTTAGTTLYERKIYGGSGPGNTAIGTKAESDLEWVLKRGEKYVFKFTTTAAIEVATNFFWYEEPDG